MWSRQTKEECATGWDRSAECRDKDCWERCPESVPRVAGSIQAGHSSPFFQSVKAQHGGWWGTAYGELDLAGCRKTMMGIL